MKRAVQSETWQRAYEAARRTPGFGMCDTVLDLLDVRCRVSASDLDRAPRTGAAMVEFLNRHRRAHDLAAMVKPRTPFWSWNPRVKDFTGLAAGDAEEISALPADIECDHKGVPVLARQYLKLGGELLGFNVDRKFSNVVDGLILVDMMKMEPRTLERYMGKDRAASFRACHSIRQQPPLEATMVLWKKKSTMSPVSP